MQEYAKICKNTLENAQYAPIRTHKLQYARVMQEYAKICKNTQEQFACCDSCTQLKKSLGHLQVANKCTQLQTVGVVGVDVGINLKYT